MVIIKQPLLTMVSQATENMTDNIVFTPSPCPYTHPHFPTKTHHKPQNIREAQGVAMGQ